MNTVSPLGSVVPFPAAQVPAPDPANSAQDPAPPSAPVVTPVSQTQIIGPELPEDKSAEAMVMAISNTNEKPQKAIADRVSDALSNSGMNVVADGVRAPDETDAFGKPTAVQVTLLDSMPDRVPE